MKIGYAKLGRHMKFNRESFGFQGDAEAANLLRRLATRNPDVEWVLIGRNDAGSMFDGTNVSNPWRNYDSKADTAEKRQRLCLHSRNDTPRATSCEPSSWELGIIKQMSELDGMVMHVGQHAPLHMHIPQANKTWQDYIDDWTTGAASPYDWALSFGGYLMRGLRALGDCTNGEAPVVYIVTDPRNKIKARDIKWPTGCDSILSQYHWDTTRPIKHERFMDPRPPTDFEMFKDHVESQRNGELWATVHKYRYGGLETMMLPDDWMTQGQRSFDERAPVGMATTSFKTTLIAGERRRSELVRDFVLTGFPDAKIYGKWDKESLADVPDGTVIQNNPMEFEDLLGSWRCTLALPALGTSWTVSKVYQAFATRTVCFMLGRLDDQGWLLPTRRQGPGAQHVGTSQGGDRLYSIRSDWTDNDIMLASWLRVETPGEFHQRALFLSDPKNAATWEWFVAAQRDQLTRRWNAHIPEMMIEERMGLHDELLRP